jgi:hypothetical protein
MEDCPSFPTVFIPLKPCGNFMYLTFYTSTKYKYCITTYLCVADDSQSKEKILPYAAKQDRYYNRYGECLLRGTV